jgi:hypothetical protein
VCKLASLFVSAARRRRRRRRDRWAYFGSFGDDCFDDEPQRAG